MKKFLVQNWPVFLIIFINLVFFGRLFWPEVRIFVTPDFGLSDLLHFNYPMRKVFAESIKNGQIPLWVDQIGTGFPFLAEGQAGVFNIINFLTAFLFPFAVGFNLTYVFSYLLMGIFTYLFARLINLDKIPALLATLVFSFSGYNITHFAHTHHIVTVSFLPVLFFVHEKALQTKQKIWWTVLAVVVSQMLLSGNVQVAAYSFLALGFYFLFRLIGESRNSRGFRMKKLTFSCFLFTTAFVLALALSAVQLLPSYELTSVSTRQQGAGVIEQELFPYPPKHLLTFLNPYLLGDPHKGTYPIYGKDWGLFWENTAYVGLVPLALAVFSIIAALTKAGPLLESRVQPLGWRTQVFFWTFLTLLSLTLSLGKYTPLFFILKFPILNLFRIPSTFLFVTDFALAILAGFGLDFLIKSFSPRNFPLPFFKPKSSDFNNRLSTLNLSIPTFFYPFILLLLTLIDLWVFGYNYNPLGKVSDWEKPPQTAEFLQKDQSDFRIWDGLSSHPWNLSFYDHGWEKGIDEYRRFLEGLKPDVNLLYEIPSANAYSGLEPERLAHFKMLFDRTALVKDEKIIFLTDPSRALLSGASVKYFVTPLVLSDPQFKLVFETAEKTGVNYRVYENTKVLPRAYVVGSYQVIKDLPRIDEYILQSRFDPVNEVILEEDPGFTPSRRILGSEAKITQSSSTVVTVDVKMKDQGVLVLADAYYPGWKARVNGEDREVVAANLYQRGLILPAGEHKVEFNYEPDSFRKGVVVSGFSWFIVLVLLLVWVARMLKDLKSVILMKGTVSSPTEANQDQKFRIIW